MKKITKFIFFTFLIFIAVSCILSNPIPPIANTPSLSLTYTQTKSVIQNNAINSATEIPSLTSMPNVTSDSNKEILINFLKTNGRCELPCLLGIQNVSDNEVAIEKFLEYFNSDIFAKENESFEVVADKELGLLNILINSSKEKVTSVFFISKWGNETDKKLLHIETLNTEKYALDFEEIEGLNLVQHYSLDNVLNTHGKPTQVLIAPFPTDPNYPKSIYPFSIILYYERSGFLMQYVSIRQESKDNYIGCLPTTYIDIFSWSPETKISIIDAASNLSGIGINNLNFNYLKKLEGATLFTLTEFYELFSSFSSKCIETPKSLWGG